MGRAKIKVPNAQGDPTYGLAAGHVMNELYNKILRIPWIQGMSDLPLRVFLQHVSGY